MARRVEEEVGTDLVLHLLGIDHTRLTVRHDGIDCRLTDVHGHDILAWCSGLARCVRSTGLS